VKRGHVQMIGFSAVLLLLLTVGTLLTAQYQDSKAPFDIGDYGSVRIADAKKAFEADGTNEQLMLLIKALCYRQESLGETGWSDPLFLYGRELYSRARAGTVDLQTVDDEDVMLKVLKVLREAGADR
jgi:hypothetical protein